MVAKSANLQTKLLKYTFDLQKVTGVHPHQKRRYSIYALFIIFTHFVMMALTVHMVISDIKDISVVMSGIEGFTTHIHGLLKYIPLLLHRKEMSSMLDGLPMFWRTKNAIEYKFWIKLAKIYLVLVAITVAVFIVYPGLLYEFYIPDFPHSYITMIVVQKTQFVYTAFIEMAADLLYLSFCGVIKVQFMRLKEDLQFLKTSENKSELLKSWIERHVFLIKYTKSFGHIFSEALLLQYMVANINLCSELYLISQRGIDGLLMGLLIMVAITFQIFLICLGAAEVTNIASEVVDALCSMEWYDLPLEQIKVLPILIQQAQVPVTFVAGGLVIMDQRTITTVLKNSYSFYALVSQIQEN